MAWQPAFSSASLEGYTALMDGCALKLCDVLQVRGGRRRAAPRIDVCVHKSVC
jgi:hypothetical protein